MGDLEVETESVQQHPFRQQNLVLYLSDILFRHVSRGSIVHKNPPHSQVRFHYVLKSKIKSFFHLGSEKNRSNCHDESIVLMEALKSKESMEQHLSCGHDEPGMVVKPRIVLWCRLVATKRRKTT
jgi:hypothetical protein